MTGMGASSCGGSARTLWPPQQRQLQRCRCGEYMKQPWMKQHHQHTLLHIASHVASLVAWHIASPIALPTNAAVRSHDSMLLPQRGAHMRSRARTGMNSSSSRSHAIFTVYVHQPEGTLLDVPAANTTSARPASQLVTRVSFVDLAGSERQARTGNEGTRLRESGAINESLRVLGAALKALCFNQAHALSGRQMRVPYRDSKVWLLVSCPGLQGCCGRLTCSWSCG